LGNNIYYYFDSFWYTCQISINNYTRYTKIVIKRHYQKPPRNNPWDKPPGAAPKHTNWRKIELQHNKAADKIFDFLSLDHYELHMNQWFDCYLENVESGNWKAGTGVTITTKQAASRKSSSKSTRTVLLQISVLAKESEVSEK